MTNPYPGQQGQQPGGSVPPPQQQWQGSAPPPPGGAPQQWQAGPPAAPSKPMDLGKILPLVAAGLGVLNFIWGMLPVASGAGFGSGFFFTGWAPVLLLVAGLLAVGGLLPKGESQLFLSTAISVPTAVAILFALIAKSSTFTSGGVALILLLIFGLLQAAATVFAWLVDADIVKMSAGGAPAYQQGPPQGYQQAPPVPQGPPPGVQAQPPAPQGPPPGVQGQPPAPQQ